MGKAKLSRGRKEINLINQLLSVVVDNRDQICKEALKLKPEASAGYAFLKESLL